MLTSPQPQPKEQEAPGVSQLCFEAYSPNRPILFPSKALQKYYDTKAAEICKFASEEHVKPHHAVNLYGIQ